MKILVFGSIAYDKIMDFPGKFKEHILPDKIHSLSVAFMVNQIKVNFGGTATNIAYSLSLLKEQVGVLGVVGKDYQNYYKWLNKNKIDKKHVRIIKDESTSTAHIITDRDDNQIAAFHLGAMKHTAGISEKLLKQYMGKALALVSPGNKDDMIKVCLLCRKLNIPFVFDPGQQIPAFNGGELKKCIQGSAVTIMNDYEIALVHKKAKLSQSKILKMTGILVVTLGSKGSMIYQGTPSTSSGSPKKYKIPIVKARKVVDPTGAGDAYRAGFLKGLIHNQPLDVCGKMGSVSSVYPIEYYGTQEHKYSWEDFKRRYRAVFGHLEV